VINMAQLWSLPIIYVCEDNQFNEYTHNSEAAAGELSGRPKAFGVHCVEVDGQDVRAVHKAAKRLVQRARKGEGPSFLLCHTYRFRGHHVGDIDRAYYRPKEEEILWETERDPLKLLADWMVAEEMTEEGALEGLREEVLAEMEAAVAFAIDAPYPDESEVDDHVYA